MYIYIYIEREREREIAIALAIGLLSADLFQSSSVLAYICNPPISSNPADSNQPLLQYLAISHPADCNLPILQSAAY